ETIEEALEAARAVQGRGLHVTLDHLGENVATLDEAAASTASYLAIIDAIARAGIDRNISLKLTALGLDMDRAHYTEATLEIFETLWRYRHRGLGVVLQAALRRSERDLERVIALGGRVRLVKGAYTEPKSIAYQKKADVDAAYARMMRRLLAAGHYPAIATHDEAMIALARQWAAEFGRARDEFEFQMLYGVRRDLQAKLAAAGYRVRIYVPFGRQWFPYFMRRL